MSGRPEALFPLFAGLETLEGVGPKTAQNLAALEVTRPRDLMFTLPHGGIDRRKRATVQGADPPASSRWRSVVGQHRAPARRGGAYRVTVEDAQTSFQLVFFHARDDYLRRILPTGRAAHRVGQGRAVRRDGADGASRSRPARGSAARSPISSRSIR